MPSERYKPGYNFRTKRGDPKRKEFLKAQRILNQNLGKKKAKTARTDKTPAVLKANTRDAQVMKTQKENCITRVAEVRETQEGGSATSDAEVEDTQMSDSVTSDAEIENTLKSDSTTSNAELTKSQKAQIAKEKREAALRQASKTQKGDSATSNTEAEDTQEGDSTTSDAELTKSQKAQIAKEKREAALRQKQIDQDMANQRRNRQIPHQLTPDEIEHQTKVVRRWIKNLEYCWRRGKTTGRRG